MFYPSDMRLVEIVLDFSLQGDFAITHDDTTICVAMCPTCNWSVIVNGLQAVATDEERHELRALFEDAKHPRSFTVEATRVTIRGSGNHHLASQFEYLMPAKRRAAKPAILGTA